VDVVVVVVATVWMGAMLGALGERDGAMNIMRLEGTQDTRREYAK
jgi:hypothetical protein